jgi:hypothetical protein
MRRSFAHRPTICARRHRSSKRLENSLNFAVAVIPALSRSVSRCELKLRFAPSVFPFVTAREVRSASVLTAAQVTSCKSVQNPTGWPAFAGHDSGGWCAIKERPRRDCAPGPSSVSLRSRPAEGCLSSRHNRALSPPPPRFACDPPRGCPGPLTSGAHKSGHAGSTQELAPYLYVLAMGLRRHGWKFSEIRERI